VRFRLIEIVLGGSCCDDIVAAVEEDVIANE
jgi:hypothetical protein